jgi:anti-anti-sigma factor
MDMNVTDAGDGFTEVALDGRFDIAGAQAVDARFQELAHSAQTLIVDLSKVTFIASLGVRTLMVGAKTMIHRGADMAVCGADENVSKVLRSTGFSEIVVLYPDFASAAAALQERRAEFENRKA